MSRFDNSLWWLHDAPLLDAMASPVAAHPPGEQPAGRKMDGPYSTSCSIGGATSRLIPSNVIPRTAGFSDSPAISMASSVRWGLRRRITAVTRASSSRGKKGLVT